MSPYAANMRAWMHYLVLINTETGRKVRPEGSGPQGLIMYEPEVRRKYMNLHVKFELKHIPRGERGSLQNFLRFSYNALRRKHMRLGLTRHETLRELVEKISKAHPNFVPEYDKDFFKL